MNRFGYSKRTQQTKYFSPYKKVIFLVLVETYTCKLKYAYVFIYVDDDDG